MKKKSSDAKPNGLKPVKVPSEKPAPAAHRKLDEALLPKLMALKTKEDVTAEKPEALVNETVRQVGAEALAELFALEPWLGDAAQASAWVCPSCGRRAPRAVDAAGNPRFEEGPLHTTQGQVRWRRMHDIRSAAL